MAFIKLMKKSGYNWLQVQLLVYQTFFFIAIAQAQEYTSPVVGILAQPLDVAGLPREDDHIVPASYVKWLEIGGMRSIPIPYDASGSLLEDLFHQINGLVIPGSMVDYLPSMDHLLKLALQASQNGDFFPVIGVCAGIEYMLSFLANTTNMDHNPLVTSDVWIVDASLPLEEVVRRKGGLFETDRIYETVTKFPVTRHSHDNGVTPEAFLSSPILVEMFNITSTNMGTNGKRHVSTVEPIHPETFPWYAFQWHPEKNGFEYATVDGSNTHFANIDHSRRGLELTSYVAQFLGDKARMALQQQLKLGTSEKRIHDYNKPTLYPMVDTYPMEIAKKNEHKHYHQFYNIPHAAHWEEEEDDDSQSQDMSSSDGNSDSSESSSDDDDNTSSSSDESVD